MAVFCDGLAILSALDAGTPRDARELRQRIHLIPSFKQRAWNRLCAFFCLKPHFLMSLVHF